MADNKLATIHLLNSFESEFFKANVQAIKDKIEGLKILHALEGEWQLSEDFKHLVKTGV